MGFKRSLLYIAFLLLFAGFVNAEITLYSNSRESYNLNDDVELSSSVLVDNDLRGFLKANVECDNYNTDYYIIPINLAAGNIESFDIPDLNLFDLMLGTCKISVLLLDNSLSLVEKESSNEFTVTDELVVNADLNKIEFLAGDSLIINGDVDDIIGEGVGEYSLNIYLDGESLETLDEDSSSFKYTLELEENIKSNSHEIRLEINDEYGNKGEKVLEFFVDAAPTKLRNKINKLDFLPGEEVSIEILLYDQGGELIYSDVTIQIYDSKNDLVLSEEGNTDELIIFTPDKNAAPGIYKIVTKNEYFEIESEFTVLEVKNVSVYLEEGELYIKNEGNVEFMDEIFISMGNFNFFEDVTLGVGEVKKILLVDEVEGGEYELIVTANNQEIDLGMVNVNDDRGVFEKVSNKITGNIILNNTGGIFSFGLIWILVILIILIGLWYYLTFNKRKLRVREAGVSEGKKTLERIKAERDRDRSGIKRTNFNRGEKKKDDSSKGGLFSMFE